MTVKDVLIRFAFAYFVLIAASFVVSLYFAVKTGIGINTLILFGVAHWACLSFGKKNSRGFTKNEQISVVLGFVVVDLLLQSVFSAIAFFSTGPSVKQIALGFGLVGVLDAVVIYYVVNLSERRMKAAPAR